MAINIFRGEIVLCLAICFVYGFKYIFLTIKEEYLDSSPLDIRTLLFFFLTIGVQLGIGVAAYLVFTFAYRFAIKDFGWEYILYGLFPTISLVKLLIEDIFFPEKD